MSTGRITISVVMDLRLHFCSAQQVYKQILLQCCGPAIKCDTSFIADKNVMVMVRYLLNGHTSSYTHVT